MLSSRMSSLESRMTTPMNCTISYTRPSSAIVLHEEKAARNTSSRATAYTAQVAPTYNGEQYARITTPQRRNYRYPAQSPNSSSTSTPGKNTLVVGTAERQVTPSICARNWQRDDPSVSRQAVAA
jgi:hypothetical protein